MFFFVPPDCLSAPGAAWGVADVDGILAEVGVGGCQAANENLASVL